MYYGITRLTAYWWIVTVSTGLCCIACQQSIYKHKMGIVCFQGLLRVVAGGGTRSIHRWFQIQLHCLLKNRSISTFRTSRSNPRNKSVQPITVKICVCVLQYPGLWKSVNLRYEGGGKSKPTKEFHSMSADFVRFAIHLTLIRHVSAILLTRSFV